MSEDYCFDIEFDDGRVAHCWQAEAQEYSDCKISAGLVTNVDPDIFYFQFRRDGEEPTTFFLRPDEMSALIYCCSGAKWSHEIMELETAGGVPPGAERRASAAEHATATPLASTAGGEA